MTTILRKTNPVCRLHRRYAFFLLLFQDCVITHFLRGNKEKYGEITFERIKEKSLIAFKLLAIF